MIQGEKSKPQNLHELGYLFAPSLHSLSPICVGMAEETLGMCCLEHEGLSQRERDRKKFFFSFAAHSKWNPPLLSLERIP